MKNRVKTNNSHPLAWAVAMIALLLLFPVTAVVYCADPGGTDDGSYRYNPEGKPDPFTPFVEIVEEHKETVLLPPLERFALGEFRLTGIVWTRNKKIAIVETPEGKRYILHRGTHIGINGGKVIEIRPDSVIVLENIKDFSGHTKGERIILALRKNGGNP